MTNRETTAQIGLTDAQIATGLEFDPDLLRVGHDVIERQKAEGFWAGWRNNYQACLWSLLISTALWMEGYDHSIINSYFGLPQFVNDFGTTVNGKLGIAASDQAALVQLNTCGMLVGLVITGYSQERFGAKRTFFGGMIIMAATIFVAVFAQNMPMLLAAEFLMGIPWGMFQTLTTAYATEICPINLRAYLAAWANVSWAGGKFVSTGVLKASIGIQSDWAWRLPFAIQWLWPAPLIIGIIFAPESPWWLVRKGRFDEAKDVIRKTARKGYYTQEEIDGYAEYMKHTDALERAENSGGSWREMFKGSNLRRTEIQMGVWMIQLWNGNAITNLTVELLQAAGMSVSFSFTFNIILNALSLVGSAVAWVLMRYCGRRPIYLWGISASIAANIIIGGMGFMNRTSSVAAAVGAIMTILNFTFQCSLGPVCYTIVGELPASRHRARSIAVGRFWYVVNAIATGQLTPYMVSETAWNWGAKSGLFWAGCGTLCFIYGYFRIPETGGFSFAELDILFAAKVPARQFKKVNVKDELVDGSMTTLKTAAIDDKQEVEHHENRDAVSRAHVLDQ